MDGTTMRKLRLAMGLTQEQVADYLQVSQQMVSQMERGVRPVATRKRWDSTSRRVAVPDFPDPSIAEEFADLCSRPGDAELQRADPPAPRGPYRRGG